jgi:hypothetical protein
MAVRRWAARAPGVLLLMAAALKLHGLALGPVSAVGWFSTAPFQIGLIVAEILLGLWLISGVAPLGSWTVGLTTFTGFAAFSFYQGVIGQSSCACFGRLSVSPWYAFGLDLLVLAGLGFGSPDLKPLWKNPGQVMKPALFYGSLVVAGVVVFASLLLGAAHLAFSSVPAAIAYFPG